MKSGFSKESRYVPTWDGNKELPESQQLKADLMMLATGELLDVLEVLKVAGFVGGTEKNLSNEQMRAVVAEAGKYLPDHVKLIGNEDFAVADIISYSRFFGLAVELLFQLVNVSSPNEADVKN